MSAPAGAPARTVDAEQAGRRIDEILEHLASTGDRETSAAAEELVRVLMDFYGGGLSRIVRALRAEPGRGSADTLAALLGDELVTSLLVLHDLHPEDTVTRIGRALATVRDPVELAGYDEATGTLRLRATTAGGGGCGCGGGTPQSVEDALACYAPEVTTVETEAAAPQQPLLQIGTRPPNAATSPARTS